MKTKQMNAAPTPQLTGQAGVYAVASELALRGLNPHFPSVDYGYDLTVEGGIRIQVKAARQQPNRKWGSDCYWFKLWHSASASGNTLRKGRPRDYSTVCDFIVFWGINEDRFWVVPSPVVAKTCGLLLGPKGFYERSEFAETRALATAGVSNKDIAARLGITTQAVTYQLKGGRLRRPRQTVTAQVRALENRWDLITGAWAALTEANTIIGEPATAKQEAHVTTTR